MGSSVRQPGFAGGEISPSLHGRTDLDRYGKGLRLTRDGLITKHGSWLSRPGTRYLSKAQSALVNASPGGLTPTVGGGPLSPGDAQYVVAGGSPVLVPFYSSADNESDDNVVLEFGEQYFNVIRDGQPVVNAYYGAPGLFAAGLVYGLSNLVSFGATIYQSLQAGNVGHQPDLSPTWWTDVGPFANALLSTPYHLTDLYKLRYAQSLDVLYLACDGYAPAKISRVGANAFAYSALTFDAPAAPDIHPMFEEDLAYGSSADEPSRAWQVATTIVRTDGDGNEIESRPVVMTAAFIKPGASWVSFLGYKSGTWVKGIFAFNTGGAVITTTGWKQSLHDGNQGNNPADDATGLGNAFWGATVNAEPIHDPDYVDQVDGYTGALVVFQDKPAVYRLWDDGTNPADATFVEVRIYRGQQGALGLVGATTGQYFTDFGPTPDLTQPPPAGTNPFNVLNGQGQVLRTETPMSVGFFDDRLVFGGTKQRPATLFFSAAGDYEDFDDRLIKTDSSAIVLGLAARKHERIRALVGKDKLFVLTNGSLWAVGSDSGPITPTNLEARVHVDVGAAWPVPVIVGNSVVWVRNQGTGLRSVEFDFSRSAYTGTDLSWQAEHLMLGHRIISMAHAENPYGVTWCAREDGALLSLTYTPDDQLWAWARHQLCLQGDGTPQRVLSVCSIPENGRDEIYLALADPAGGAAWIVRFSTRAELDDEALQSIAAQGGGFEYDIGMGLGQQIGGQSSLPAGRVANGSPICLDAWRYTENKATDGNGIFFFSGLDIYAGRNVWVIVDTYVAGAGGPQLFTVDALGNLQVPTPVPGGVFPYTAGNIYIGLPFAPEGEMLDLPGARETQKVVPGVAFEVLAHSKFKVGPDLGDLNDIDPPSATNDLVRMLIVADWTSGGRVAWRQYLPLPLTIRAITRGVSLGSL